MSDDAPTPAGDDARDPWPVPASGPTDEPRDAKPGTTPRVPLDKTAPADAAPGAASPLPPNPWAAPGGAAQSGPGHTIAGNEPQGQAPPSVHDQQTMISLPGVTPQPWADPFGRPQPHGTLGGFPPPDPATAVGGPPPGRYAPPVHGGPVPPPPIAPDGPGQIPYGYPGGYGYPSHPQYGGAPGLYGWAGGVGDNNGTGVAGLVLGILAAVVFCLWPLAIVFGILGIVFGAIGRGKARRGEASNPGQALAGIICGVVGTVLAIGVGILVMVAP
ncbi:DUF4190 domain-containing protein [Streptomyces sp. NPDC001027]|uniref:DUF4190 domain-containing protein n=1 Tax=Streptomyces sp. NPDC001027 TaxID=3154771 RepID=UPI0033193B64